ncbi:GIY-YIG nuclease family protein [Aquisalinus flavus]|uniref:GIY-YIG domain-containing protein n=1 Tax=Aquisalinus flavus TaxID=1526572 RepID=A0A8J2V498_9PROT|nr:GIY-YIG nuclease family protein [Aquisalinus flavus]MBD0427895.1 GIY-YIG nuclease family protein [Aquisalinus flavus]UNE47656.1 GIY-YIG nuclease family protein [Aquisalinus flavus]GGD04715.1 hypothetical protein GCM10011342_12120 [Aquisalinus flavus]
MKYVYIPKSELDPDRHYVGIASDLKDRLSKHNCGAVAHTAKFRPWAIKTYLAFSDHEKALAFEKYLKTASDRAFSKKQL